MIMNQCPNAISMFSTFKKMNDTCCMEIKIVDSIEKKTLDNLASKLKY